MFENLRAQEQLLRCGVLPVHRTMEDAELVDDHVGVTFDVELCVPWDAPEAVVDINSTDVVTLGSVPDKVGFLAVVKMQLQAVSCRGGIVVVSDFWFPMYAAWTRIFTM